MIFKVKDLLINILPSEGTGSPGEELQFGGGYCAYSTTMHYMASMASWLYNCPNCLGAVVAAQAPVNNPQLVGELQSQLQAALDSLGMGVAESSVGSLQPQTLGEVAEIESKMADALKELKRRRQELENQ